MAPSEGAAGRRTDRGDLDGAGRAAGLGDLHLDLGPRRVLVRARGLLLVRLLLLGVVVADRADAGEEPGVVGEDDEDEDAAHQREDAPAGPLAGGALDEAEQELDDQLEGALGTTRHDLRPPRDDAPD